MTGISARFSNSSFVLFCYITNHLMTGPLGNSKILFPSNLNVPSTSSRGTLRFSGNKIHCSPRDQSLSVNCYTTVVTLRPEIFFYSFLANFATRTASFIFLLPRSAESREKKALCHQPLIIVSDWRIFLIALRVI